MIGPADLMLATPPPSPPPCNLLLEVLGSIERALLDAADGLGGRPPPPICSPAAAAEEGGASNPRTTSGPPPSAPAPSCELPRASEAAASDGDGARTEGERGLGEAARTSPRAVAAAVDEEGVGVTETEGEGDLARAGTTFETEALLLGVSEAADTVVEGDDPPFFMGGSGLKPSIPPPPLPRREEVLNPGGAGLGGRATAPPPPPLPLPLPLSLLDENHLVMSGLAVGGADTRRSANESEYRNSGDGARADRDRTGGGGYCCSV